MMSTTISSDKGPGRTYSLAADVRMQMGRLRSVALLLLAVVLVAGPLLAWFNSQTKPLDGGSGSMVWSFLKENYLPFYLMALVLGVAGGLWAESYQQVPRQSNFYHALSPRRGQLLTARVLAVLFLQMGLALVAAAGIVLVGLVSPTMSLEGFLPRLVVFGLANWIHITLVFLLALSVTLLAGQLAGSVISQLIMALVLFISPALCGLATGMVLDATSSTYVSEGLALRLAHFDPLYPWLAFAGSTNDNVSVLDIPFSDAFWTAAPYVSYAVVIALSLFLTFRLYRRRPAEKAGETLVYRSVGTLIKVEFVILATLFVGTLFYCLSLGSPWAFGLGAVFAGLVVQMVSEMIYAQDVRGWKNKLPWSLLGMALACLIFWAFASGLTGYDHYVPQASSLRAVHVEVTGSDVDSEPDLSDDQDPAYLQKAVACMQELAANHAFTGVEAAISSEQSEEDGQCLTVNVSYRTRSGLESTRTYFIPVEKAQDILTPLMDDPNYGKSLFGSLLKLTPQDIGEMNVSLNTPVYLEDAITLSLVEADSTAAQSERAKALLEAMQKDLTASGLNRWASNSMAMVTMDCGGTYQSFVVRQGDANVRALLESWIGQGLFGSQINDIGAAVLEGYDAVVVQEGQGNKTTIPLTDPQTLTDVLADGIIIDGIPVDADPSAQLKLTGKDSDENVYTYTFRQGHVPTEENNTQAEQPKQ